MKTVVFIVELVNLEVLFGTDIVPKAVKIMMRVSEGSNCRIGLSIMRF